MKLLIVGMGFVGTATEYLFKESWCNGNKLDPHKIFRHDPAKGWATENPAGNFFDYIFLCLPTNLDPVSQKLDLSILKEAYERWRHAGKVVIRSTIGPDQIDEFPDAIFMPEFLRENNWKEDVSDSELPIIVSDEIFGDLLRAHIFANQPSNDPYYKKIITLPPAETVMWKLTRNAALGVKVALANELSEICKIHNIDYALIKLQLETDQALGYSHWQVPGPDGKLGFGGHCLPKDLTHMASLWYNHPLSIVNTALEMNKKRRSDLDK